MPSFHCRHPTCSAVVQSPGYCPKHAPREITDEADRQRLYDQTQRDPESKAFYDSAAWQRCRRQIFEQSPICARCNRAFANHVHHKKPLKLCLTLEEKLDLTNLVGLCPNCHAAVEQGASLFDETFVSGSLSPAEDETYFYDADAAERVIRFIETFCIHYEGRHAGNPFLLRDEQKQILRHVYGFKRRDTRQRRFRQIYWEAAAGAGKSPLLAALGIFGLMADGERGAQVFSVATTETQARIVFDAAKAFIEQSPRLSKLLRITKNAILFEKTRSTWEIAKGKAKSGMRPSLVLADELHEWPNRQMYDALESRMAKRENPLWISATNAGDNRESLCWQLHEMAVKTLRGDKSWPSFYPIIWAAPPNAKDDDPAAWRAANPLLGTTTREEKVADELEKARDNPYLMGRFKRFYLTHWTQKATRWIDLARWDAASAPLNPAEFEKLPLYVGLDLSQNDDLCAAAFVWVSAEKVYLDAKFWLPRATAEHYQRVAAIPYLRWEKEGHIELLDQPTIDAAAAARIAADVVRCKESFDLRAVAYDRYKADACIAAIEAAGITAIPIAQGYTLTPGCQELDRRLKDTSMVIAPNPVLRMCAANVEVKGDERGNFWPVKPNAKGQYAGTRATKIDGIAAAVTALTEARKSAFPAASKEWSGDVFLL